MSRNRRAPWLMINPPIDGLPATWSNVFYIVHRAKDQAPMRPFHAVALATGDRDKDAPGRSPAYAPKYFAAHVRDPDGNKPQFEILFQHLG